MAATVCGNRLPVPSHDTYLWFLADWFDRWKWRSINVRDRGVGVRSRWKGIREAVCASHAWDQHKLSEIYRNVQLEITTACNLACPNCDRCCGTAPSGEHMTVGQIEHFLSESAALGVGWDRIDVIGGEPTLHKRLPAILDAIERYRREHPCRVRLSTNGTGKQVQSVLATLPDWLQVRNSAKEDARQRFTAYNMAPRDVGEPNALACSIPWRCGLGLTRYGYFPCGAGAAIARVFGLDVGAKRLAELTPEKIRAQLAVLCPLCGHSNSTAHKVTTQQTSKSWSAALRKYKANDSLALYPTI